VTESGPIVDSQTSNTAQVVNRQMLAGLPLPNRAASSLAALAPGVVMIDTGTGTRRKLSGVQRRRRPRAQPDLPVRRRQCLERRRTHPAPAVDEPCPSTQSGISG